MVDRHGWSRFRIRELDGRATELRGVYPRQASQRRGQTADSHPRRLQSRRWHSRTGEHQGHGEGRRVQQVAVLALAVLAEALAVIRDHRDHPGAPHRSRAETVE